MEVPQVNHQPSRRAPRACSRVANPPPTLAVSLQDNQRVAPRANRLANRHQSQVPSLVHYRVLGPQPNRALSPALDHHRNHRVYPVAIQVSSPHRSLAPLRLQNRAVSLRVSPVANQVLAPHRSLRLCPVRNLHVSPLAAQVGNHLPSLRNQQDSHLLSRQERPHQSQPHTITRPLDPLSRVPLQLQRFLSQLYV